MGRNTWQRYKGRDTQCRQSHTHTWVMLKAFSFLLKKRALTEARRELETLRFNIRADCWNLTQGFNGGKQDPPVDFYFNKNILSVTCISIISNYSVISLFLLRTHKYRAVVKAFCLASAVSESFTSFISSCPFYQLKTFFTMENMEEQTFLGLQSELKDLTIRYYHWQDC